jgi:hypothetical protein
MMMAMCRGSDPSSSFHPSCSTSFISNSITSSGKRGDTLSVILGILLFTVFARRPNGSATGIALAMHFQGRAKIAEDDFAFEEER